SESTTARTWTKMGSSTPTRLRAPNTPAMATRVTERPAPREMTDLKDLKAMLAIPVRRVTAVRWVTPVRKATRVPWGPRVRRATRGYRAQRGQQAPPERRGLLGRRALRARPVTRAQRGQQVTLEQQVTPERPEAWGILERPGIQVPLATLER